MSNDLSFAIRRALKAPGITIVIVITLALGIGVNLAIFSIFYGVMLRYLPVKRPMQLVTIDWTARKPINWSGVSSYVGCDAVELPAENKGCSFTSAEFEFFRAHSVTLSDLIAFAGPGPVRSRFNGDSSMAEVQFVSGNFFSSLGVVSSIGQTLTRSDDTLSEEPNVVLSYAYWRQRFGGSADVIGQEIFLEGIPFRVIGVAQQSFFGLQPVALPDLWIPVDSRMLLGSGWWARSDSTVAWLFLIGRMKPRINLDRVRDEFDVLFRESLNADLGTSQTATAGPSIVVRGGARGLAGLRLRYSTSVEMLMGIAGLVLLIACANVANLLLVRASLRRNEIGLRIALGATRMRLFRQFAAESMVLTVLGAASGTVMALWASHGLAAVLAKGIRGSVLIDTSLDLHFLLVAAVGMCVAVMIFGTVPYVIINDSVSNRNTATRGSMLSQQVGHRAFGRLSVVVQTALVVILLVAAGLLLRTLVKLETADSGFEKGRLLTVVVKPREGASIGANSPPASAADIPTPASGAQMTGELVTDLNLKRHLEGLPGVSSVTWCNSTLLTGARQSTRIRLDIPNTSEIEVDFLKIGPNFFDTMGIPVVTGRGIQLSDFASEANAVWVNQTFAKRFYGLRNPLGDHIPPSKPLSPRKSLEIVGVVADFKYQSIRSEVQPSLYVPGTGAAVFDVRTHGDPTSMVGAVRQSIERASANIEIANIKSEAAQVSDRLSSERMMAELSAMFAALGLLLASIGTYGVLAYSVSQRRSEIAMRTALGAAPRQILSLLLGEGICLTGTGITVGVLCALWLTRFLKTFLYGVTAIDVITYTFVIGVVLSSALLACYVPARKAMYVDPMSVLRNE